MAPEQFQGRPCTASDQYAVGVLVYEWICGVPPFSGAFYDLGYQHLYQPPPSLCARMPQLPPAIENAVFRALAKDPQQRYPCLQDFAEALEEAYREANRSLSLHTIPAWKQEISTLPTPTLNEMELGKPVEQEPIALKTLAASINQVLTRPLAAIISRTNRLRLLRRVRSYWITGVLEHSLHGASLIALGLEEQSDAVVSPWRLVVQQPEVTSRPFPMGTRIKDIYDAANGELLILGAPGSGKTMLLLELARDLLDQAEHDEHHPIPVVFNLSTWATKRQRLVDWFVEELASKYQVPRKLGKTLLDAEQILPLLDGLDEVAPRERTACIKAINTYREEHGLLPLVVCSRRADYLAQTTRLQLDSAVVVQSLTEQQIEDYLIGGGKSLQALQIVLHQDPELRELAHTPLMLSTLALAYHGMPVEQLLHLPASSEARQQQVFKHYVERMLNHKGTKARYTQQQTMHHLSWLAGQLARRNQAVFYIERMQPDWLEDQSLHQRYQDVTIGLIFGLIGAFCLGPIDGLIFAPTSWSPIFPAFTLFSGLVAGSLFGLLNGFFYEGEVERRRSGKARRQRKARRPMLGRLARGVFNGWLVGLLVGIPYGISLWQLPGSNQLTFISATAVVIGLVGGLAFILIDAFLNIQTTEIRPSETFAWSWKGMVRNLVLFSCSALLGSLLLGLLFGLFSALYTWVFQGTKNIESLLPGILLTGEQFALAFGPFLALISGLLGMLTGGLSGNIIDERNLTTPNQGIRRSARYGIVIGIVSMVIGGIVGGLLGGVRTGLGIEDPRLLLTYALIFGPLIGLVSGLRAGGIACIQHLVLRWLLWRASYIPWNYGRFLDYAAEHILLRKVGGGYMFVHRLLLEYFANNTPTFPPTRVEPVQAGPPVWPVPTVQSIPAIQQTEVCICGSPYRPGARFCPNCGRPKEEIHAK